MKQSHEMLSVGTALEEILRRVNCLNAEEVSILEAAGRVLRESIKSSHDVPSFDNSAMDGYAVRSEDTLHSTRDKPSRLKIVEEIPAGASPRFRLGRDEAAAIMTGACVPEGADSVVMVEDTRRDGDSVFIEKPIEKNDNVRERGQDVKAGETVLPEGMFLTPSCAGMLAELGRTSCLVTRRPKVSIIVTGDEVFEPGDDLPTHGIRNANGYSLLAGVAETGSIPVYLGIARDNKEELRERLETAFQLSDMVVTSGGVSVGKYDWVKEILSGLGEIVFQTVRMQPGKPTVFGMRDNKPFFGLPGNPVSCVVVFEQLVRPAIIKMCGRADIERPIVTARLKKEIKKKPEMTAFVRGKLTRENDTLFVTATGPQGSGILKSLVVADGLIIIPEDKVSLPGGTEVQVKLLSSNWPCAALMAASTSPEGVPAWRK
ncbi:MAG: molybdopterin molybdotransferase MoeA [Candidatus Eisenbacteria bacterium]|nr:molybdopterin molybdotransferase MoeA [Candidatus Eisenbacteria bacterium]